MPISWQTMKWLRISRKLEGYLLFKSSLFEEGFRRSSSKKTKSSSTCSKKATALDRLCDKPRALKVETVHDFRNLLQFIPPIHHGFYNAIKSDGPLKGHANDVLFHPDLACSNEEYIQD